jgi:hypothetical protein
MDNLKENESVVRMRSTVSSWLSSDDWNSTRLIDWFQGYDLPALGHEEEPYLWLLRGIPESGERRPTEKAMANRVAVLLREQPDVRRPGRRPDQVLYNLFMFCAGLSSAEELADPLFEVLERYRLQGKWHGVDLRTSLKAALIANQLDARLWSVWEESLVGEPKFLPLDESELVDAVRLMPQSPDRRGEPAIDFIGRALKLVAERRSSDSDKEEIFASLTTNVMDTYPGHQWGRDLLVQAMKHDWPKWAVENIPVTYPEYVSEIIRTVRKSPFIHSRSIKGVILHGLEEGARLELQSNGQSLKEAYRKGLKLVAVGA